MQNLKDVFRTAVTALLFLVLASLLIYNRSNAAATAKSTAPVRGYYLTRGTFDGSHALGACVAGYHMASIYEVHEPSNLRYDTNLGVNEDDSGLGPPTLHTGWIRTGFNALFNTGLQGFDNCNAWTSNSAADTGTNVYLELDFIGSSGATTAPWLGQLSSCSNAIQVWCVQD
jgi:hypothetical protein